MEYCTISEGATKLKLSRPTVYKMIENGILKTYSFLGRPALSVAQVDRVKNKLDAKRNGGNKVKKRK